MVHSYASPAAFSRAFARQYGVSPSSARGAGVMLTPYPKISFQIINEERADYMETKNNLQIYGDRGYYVRENEPISIYVSQDMDKTIGSECFVTTIDGSIIGFCE